MADEPSSPGSRPWMLPLLLAVVLAGVILLGRRPAQEQPPAAPPAEPATGKTVHLVVDYGDGRREEFPDLPWSEGATVADAMDAARRAGSRFSYDQKGQGPTGFLTAIGGVGNQGVGGLNWLYEVNGQPAQAGFCVRQLEPGDTILWNLVPEE